MAELNKLVKSIGFHAELFAEARQLTCLMAEEESVLIIFIDRLSNVNIKSERNSRRLTFPQFKCKNEILVCRNEFSYMVEAIMDILRILIDIFYKTLNLYICIDGNIIKFLSKNVNNYRDLIKVLNKNDSKPTGGFKNYIDNLLKCTQAQNKKAYLISLFSWKNKSDLQSSLKYLETVEKVFHLEKGFLYNLSKNYYISNDDWKQISHSKIYQIRNSTAQFLSMELIKDILATFDLSLVNISDIPVEVMVPSSFS
ncbi:hypothetical protein HZS_855 [Henneguya salminicola]|nr:hypothetical protein HZS_855 [Henneguya salminicola]